MFSILSRNKDPSAGDSNIIVIDEDEASNKPYLISEIYYLAVVLFIGIPIWFYTCSVTRYSLPQLNELEHKLQHSLHSPTIHLDVSIVNLNRLANQKTHDDGEPNSDELALMSYIREHLPQDVPTSVANVSYHIDWRVRRPTDDEQIIFSNHQKNNANDNLQGLQLLESQLLKTHGPANRFRLFIYIPEKSFYSFYCDTTRVHSYNLGFERFIHLCPSYSMSSKNDYGSIVSLINEVIRDVYSDNIDVQHLRSFVLKGQFDLLMSLMPEKIDREHLSRVADTLHSIYDKRVKAEFPEIKELAEIRLITQYVIDLLDQSMLSRISTEPVSGTQETRYVLIDEADQLFPKFDARLDKHSSRTVHNVLSIVSEPKNGRMVFRDSKVSKATSDYQILERQDMNSMMLINDNKSLVLQLRAITRKSLGLKSPDLNKNCLVRRDVFFNRWEIDSIMGALTVLKLQEALVSLQSICKYAIGIKIPLDVAAVAKDSRDLALESLHMLSLKQSLEAYRLASDSYRLSEAAYYDPSLLESLYFPDDLKFAIYTPAFVPLGMIFGLSLLRVLRYFMRGGMKRCKVKTQ